MIFDLLNDRLNKTWNFIDANTPIMEGIINLHHDIMFFMFVILFSVLTMLLLIYYTSSVVSNARPSSNTHGTLIEIIWTITPALILVAIAFPTFALIYSLDDGIEPELTVKVIANQWYWSYEFGDFGKFNRGFSLAFDSYLVKDSLFSDFSETRMLTVDNPVYLPISTFIRFLITSTDVLHCWAVPALGIKMDAVPGRLNQAFAFLNNLGTFYGQCSEICGINHAFMPIEIRAVTMPDFINWVLATGTK